MFLARIVGAGKPQVYPLTGKVFVQKAWRFMSYRLGSAAIAPSQTEAVVAARRELRRNVRLVVQVKL